MTGTERRPFELVRAQAPAGDAPGRAVFRLARAMAAQDVVRALVPSKPQLNRIFANGQLRDASGVSMTRTDPIAAGEEVELLLVPEGAMGPTSDAPLRVLYEDPFLLAADKPAGILVHADGTDTETLTARVRGHLRRLGSAAAPQALHRLDVDTTGIVLFSLTRELQPAFDALVAADGGDGRRGLRKRYYALIEGSLPRVDADGWMTVDAPIARDRHDARRMRVGRTGKAATTRVRTVERRGVYSLVEAELVTGRRHQIRVHLAHLGHPIVGDALYGGATSNDGLHLHAHGVRLVHPVTYELLSLESPCPW